MTAGPGRLLVANRGEIAVRVLRAARDLGWQTVAVYSEADRCATHVRMADHAVCIGPAPASASYLRGDLLLHVAQATGCSAVHPGYGFLSEDAQFAQHTIDAGCLWVGPPPAAIATMANKSTARQVMAAAGVPVVPGSPSVLDSPESAQRFGEDHGYPLLLKARAGGGGRGMRVVGAPQDLVSAFRTAEREAAEAFGDGALYVEKYLDRVRHVEVQVVADQRGRVLALGERDCSVQRRHQKMLEETPSPAVSIELGESLRAAAALAAQAAGYVNAGTVEFLLDVRSGAFYFIEMNTRIQVEHPITEEVTGLDLVAWQLRLALGEPLAFDSPPPRGHAIEFRITAEDPQRGFLPCPGTIGDFVVPTGPGVRVDTHCHPGAEVPPYYDSLLAKLVVRGADRPEALRRARRALAEFRISGIPTSLPLHERLLRAPAFLEGAYTTAWLEQWMDDKPDLFTE